MKKFNLFSFHSNAGQSLIELMVAIGLFAILLPALFAGFAATRGGRAQQDQRQQAIQLAKEGQEAVRVVREANWSNITDGTYYPSISGSTWSLNPGSQTLSGFTRSITISDVYRDSNGIGNIVAVGTMGSALDLSTKKVMTTVCWSSCAYSVSANEYITRNANLSYTENTTSQFLQGTYDSSIQVTNNTVILGSGTVLANWCKPNPGLSSPIALPGNGKAVSAISEAAGYSNGKGHSYTTSGGNASGDSMDSVDVTDPTPPTVPSASLGFTYNPSKGNGKAYGIYVDPSTNLAYIALDNSSKATVGVFNATTGAPVTSYDVSGNGQSVYYSSGYVYVTVGNVLHAINTTTSKDNTITLDGNGLKVVVAQPFAYVATDNATHQLDIINITDPTKMTKTSVNLGNSAAGVDLSIDSAGANVAIVTANVTPKKDIFLYNIATKAITKSYDSIGMSPNGVALTPEGILIAVGSGGQQYQVFDTTSANPSCPAGLTNPNGASVVNSVSYLKEPDGDAFAYIVTSGGTEGNTRYFQIIAGGSGGGGLYTSSGMFQSQTIPVPILTHNVAFNNFSVSTTTSPPTTNITYKIAIKAGGGTCTGVSYVDSDFVSFSPGPLTIGTIGTYVNPGECLKYRAYLSTTDPNQTPVLKSITFDYSL